MSDETKKDEKPADLPRSLSLHDSVAFRAMQAMLSNPDLMAEFAEHRTKLESFDQFVARRSYDHAKALLDERRKRIDTAGGRRGKGETGSAVRIDYTNHRGERRVRTVHPRSIEFAANQWHPQAQWLLVAYDVEKREVRSFAMASIHSWEQPSEVKP